MFPAAGGTRWPRAVALVAYAERAVDVGHYRYRTRVGSGR